MFDNSMNGVCTTVFDEALDIASLINPPLLIEYFKADERYTQRGV